MELAELIFSWAEINILYLAAVHLNGELNTLTYTLSREQFSHTEWNLNQEPRSVHYDHSKMGPPRDKPFCYLKEQKGGEIIFDAQGIKTV